MPYGLFGTDDYICYSKKKFMKKIAFAFFVSTISTLAIAQVKKPAPTVKKVAVAAQPNPLKTLKDSASYALGVNIATNLQKQFGTLNMALLQKGLSDVYAGKKLILTDEIGNNAIGNFQSKAQSEKANANKLAGQKFLAANAKRTGVIVLPDGLQYEIIKKSSDTTKPTLNSKVKCHYHGTLIDGTVFDSSVDRGEPITFPLNGVIRGWQEALQLMTVGSKWRLYLPSDLAYGDNAAGPKIGPGSTLIFDVELLGIEK
jgi:FKBP-type peptidyl-prolyl cis-trans isomerase FklB